MLEDIDGDEVSKTPITGVFDSKSGSSIPSIALFHIFPPNKPSLIGSESLTLCVEHPELCVFETSSPSMSSSITRYASKISSWEPFLGACTTTNDFGPLSLMPFSGACTSVYAIKTASREPRSTEDLLTLPRICFHAFNPASLTPFPGACTFADAVKTASGKHLLEAFFISFAPRTFQTGSHLAWT